MINIKEMVVLCLHNTCKPGVEEKLCTTLNTTIFSFSPQGYGGTNKASLENELKREDSRLGTEHLLMKRPTLMAKRLLKEIRAMIEACSSR